LIADLHNAAVVAKENAAPDVVLANDKAEHLLVECKASMFGPGLKRSSNESNQRQARSFLLQVPEVLSSALAGAKVSGSHLAYLTRHDAAHEQSDGVRQIAKELKAANFPVVDCCLLRLIQYEGGIGIVSPKRAEKWPKGVRSACKPKSGKSAVTVIPRDDSGNDLRPLYFIPWMPDSEPQPNEYNRRAFGNRLLSAAIVRVGRSVAGDDITLNFEELLNEVTVGIFGRWRNKEAKKSLRKCAQKLIYDHLKKASALTNDPDGTGQSVRIKIADEKVKAAIIKAFRETIAHEWDKPDPQMDMFDTIVEKDAKE
jgi:hypothetical protein